MRVAPPTVAAIQPISVPAAAVLPTATVRTAPADERNGTAAVQPQVQQKEAAPVSPDTAPVKKRSLFRRVFSSKKVGAHGQETPPNSRRK